MLMYMGCRCECERRARYIFKKRSIRDKVIKVRGHLALDS